MKHPKAVRQFRANWHRRAAHLRGRWIRLLTAGAMCAVTGVLVSACGGSSASGTTDATQAPMSANSEGGTLRIGLGPEVSSLDPAAASSSGRYSATILDLAYAPLFHMAPNGEIEPALATSWHYVKGTKVPNSVFELTLRQDAAYSDGTPVTGATVARWLTYFSKGTGSFASVFGESPKFTATDKYTVKVVPGSPNPAIPVILSDGGMNAGFVLGPKGMDAGKELDETNGAGPYMLDTANTVRGDHLTFIPNPHYYDKSAIHFSKVEVKIIPEATSRFQAQVSGQLDVTEGDTQTVAAAEESGLEIVGAPFNVIYLALNSGEGNGSPLEDVRVRQAMNLAIDKKSISEALFGKWATPTSSFLTSDVDWKFVDYWPYEPEKAKKLLAEAGYSNGFKLKAITQGPFYGNLGQPLLQAAAKNLAEVGITLDITPYSTEAEYAEALVGDTSAWDVGMSSASIRPTPVLYPTWLSPEGPVNFSGEDPRIASLYDAGANSDDPSIAWEEMWKRYTEQAYALPLITADYLNYASDDIGGVNLTAERSTPVPTEWFRK